MPNKTIFLRLLGAMLLAGFTACSGNQASVRPEEGYAQAVTATPGTLLYYEQLAETQSENADVHFDLAIRYAGAGKLDKAEASYKQALVIKPTHVPAAVNLSDVYRGRGNYEGAIKVLEDLFGNGTDDPRARTNLAALYRMTDRLDESLKQSILITKKYGVLYGAKLNIGLIYYDRGRYDMALTVLNELLRENPNDAILRSSIGQVYLRQDRVLQAEEQFKNAVTLDTKSFSAWNGLGLVSLRKDENDEALGFFDKALEANVNYSQAYVNRGIALRKLGRYTEAGESYDKAVEINPTLFDASYNRGVLYDDYARNFTEAVVFWKQFRDTPNFPLDLTAEVEGRIDRLGKWLVRQEEERKRRTEKESAMAEKKKVEAAKKAEADRLKAEERKKAEAQERLEAARLAAEAAQAAAIAAAAATAASQTPAPAMVSAPVKKGPVEMAEPPLKRSPVSPAAAPLPGTEATKAPTGKVVPVAAPETVKSPVKEIPPSAAAPLPGTEATKASAAKVVPVAAPVTKKPEARETSAETPSVPSESAPKSAEKPALAEGPAAMPVTAPSP